MSKLGKLDPQSRVRLAQTLRNPAVAPTEAQHAATLMALNASEARGLPKMPKSLLAGASNSWGCRRSRRSNAADQGPGNRAF